MSKVVKGIGSAISGVTRVVGKVVQGVQNLTKSVIKGTQSFVKKVASSKIGKIVLIAAAVYFGGAALMGGLGAPAGTGLSGFMSGAGQGITNAWSGLTGAASSAMGGNFSAAGSQLSAGFQGTTIAAQNAATAANAAANAANVANAGTGATTVTNPALSQVIGPNGLPGVPLTTPPPPSPGIISGAWNSLGDYGKMAVVQAGGKVVEGVGQQNTAEEQQKREERLAAEGRQRYSDNVGVLTFDSNFGQDSGSGTYAQAAPTGLVAGAMTPRQQYEEEMRRQQASYSPYQLRTA